MSRRLLFPAWCAGLASALIALHLLGDTDLALPFSPAAWSAHVDRVGPAAVIVGVVRLGAMALAWYLVAVTVGGVVTRSVGADHAVAVADAVTPRFLRRLMASAGGLLISGAGLALATAPVAIGVDPADSTSTVTSSDGVATFRQLSPVAVPIGQHREPAVSDAGDDPPDRQAPDRREVSTAEFSMLDLSGLGGALARSAVARTAETWTVDCGDHLWLIAEEVLADAAGSVPDDDMVTDYWLTLIAANQDRLVAPDNPDLLLPGQVLAIPAPPVAS